MSLDCSVVLTQSGVRAMLDRNTGELMHPGIGPLAEAELLYVGASRLSERLGQATNEPLVLFDVGLGAGTNAAAAFRLSEKIGKRPLRIISFDHSLAAFELALEPSNASAFGLDGLLDEARELLAGHECRGRHTEWRVVLGELPASLQRAQESTDIVFWDPFSPGSNPELWTLAAFASVRAVCRKGATLHTYSGATAVRSALLLAGFSVGLGARLGPGKRATEAALDAQVVEPLDLRWLQRFGRSSAPLPVDAPADAASKIAEAAQFQP